MVGVRLDALPDGVPSAKSGSTITTTSHRARSSRRCSARSFRWRAIVQLPVVIHTREAEADTLGILGEGGARRQPGCSTAFPATPPAAARALATGFYLSIPGIVSFPARRRCARRSPRCPLDRLLVETDSPYLAPVPFRGKRNEPAYVAPVVEQWRRGAASPCGAARRSFANATRLFRL